MVKNITIAKALIPFLTKPRESLHLSAIARELCEPHPTIRQWLGLLAQEGIVKKTHKGRMSLYTLNFEHPNLSDYLLIIEKYKLIEKCEKELLFRELVSLVRLFVDKSVIVLIFGSAVKSFTNANDIDILLIGDVDIKDFKKSIEKLKKEVHIVKVSSFEKISNALKIEIIKKHILIQGSEESIGWLSS